MKTNSTFYRIYPNNICRSYASHNENFITLSVGDKNSPNTDTGIRIMCEAAKQHKSYRYPKIVLTSLANQVAQWLGLPPQSLNITFYTVFVENGDFFVRGIGNGIVILKNKENKVYIISLYSTQSYYVNYIKNKEDEQKWAQQQNNKHLIQSIGIEYVGEEKESSIISTERGTIIDKENKVSLCIPDLIQCSIDPFNTIIQGNINKWEQIVLLSPDYEINTTIEGINRCYPIASMLKQKYFIFELSNWHNTNTMFCSCNGNFGASSLILEQ